MNKETLLSDLRYKIISFTIPILEEGMKKMRGENNKIVEKEENKNEKGDG